MPNGRWEEIAIVVSHRSFMTHSHILCAKPKVIICYLSISATQMRVSCFLFVFVGLFKHNTKLWIPKVVCGNYHLSLCQNQQSLVWKAPGKAGYTIKIIYKWINKQIVAIVFPPRAAWIQKLKAGEMNDLSWVVRADGILISHGVQSQLDNRKEFMSHTSPVCCDTCTTCESSAECNLCTYYLVVFSKYKNLPFLTSPVKQ